MRYVRIIALLVQVFFSVETFAQAASIRGFIYTKANGEPSIFTTVYLRGTTYGANSDVNGYYSISKIPPGNYILMVTSLGFDTIKETVSVKANEILSKKLYLIKSTLQLNAVEVSAETEAKKTDARVSVNTITPKEINKIPSVGGEPDIAQYLQVLPGVIFTGDQGGQLYIRGGSPVQNKVLLDGMIIYNPFHSIGLFSVFDMDIIRHADVYTGGFGAQYGGRISSIMDFTTRDGNKKRYSGKVSASPFVGRLLLEGPVFKSKTEDGGSASFVLSAKTSYLPSTSKLLYTYVNPEGLPFSFNDLYGKVSLSSANGSKLNVFGFHFDDHVKYQSVSDFKWITTGIGSNFVLVPSASPVLIQGNFAYSKYKVDLTSESDTHSRTSDISGFNMGIDLTYFLNRKNSFSYGVEVVGFTTNFDFFNSVNREITQQENTTELGGYLSYKFLSKNEKFVLEPSVRGQYYASLSEFSPEPRIDGKYNISNRIRFKFAGGWYSQNLISATSDRDVVNLFYGFLAGPDNLQSKFTDQNGNVRDVTSRLQKANHLIAGFEFDLFKHIDMNIEVYRKNFTQLTNLNRNKLYEDNSDPDNVNKPDYLKKDFIIETGKAQGVDVTLKYDYKRFYFWAVYSLTYVDRWDGVLSYNPVFDRRHNINLVSSYTFGKNLNWEIDARWNFGSGFPFTPTAGFYEKLDFSGGINTNYTNANGILGVLYGDLNSKRLPTYHRFDLSIKRRFELSEHSTLEMSAGATNIYNRENIFYFDRVLYKRVNQLPILPSISANLTF
jgi:hypothetical protein